MQLALKAGIELRASGLQFQLSNCSATLPPAKSPLVKYGLEQNSVSWFTSCRFSRSQRCSVNGHLFTATCNCSLLVTFTTISVALGTSYKYPNQEQTIFRDVLGIHGLSFGMDCHPNYVRPLTPTRFKTGIIGTHAANT